MMTFAVIDDSSEILSVMKDLINEYAAVNRLDLSVDCFLSPVLFLKGYRPYRYSLVFLDIYMDEMSGLDVASEIRNKDRNVVIVFLTSSNEHRPEAFRFHAFDYIMKPADRSRVFGVLNDFFQLQSNTDSERFSFFSDRILYSLPINEIVTIQTSGHYLDVLDAEKNTYRTRMSFSDALKLLAPSGRFLQLLRGVLANMDYISGFSGDTCILYNGTRLPVTIRHVRELEDIWKNYKFKKIRESANGREIQ
ncbi:MAG: response regulator transcription factor [Oscillospiraceae bacterium]|nr:response regulator transcription factor [Oscillospiraceae bacterium]